MANDPQTVQRARKAFTNNYARASFTFTGPFIEDVNQGTEGLMRLSISIRNFAAIQQLLTHFGHLIGKITVNFDKIGVNEGKKIIELMNNHCFESLKDLNLLNCKAIVLSDLKDSFQNVQTLQFSSHLNDKLQFTTEKMCEIFPNIETLYIRHTISSDWTFIHGNFNKLQLLNVQLPRVPDRNGIDRSHVANFLSMNTHLPALTVTYCSVNLLSEISEILPRLNRLQIYGLSNERYSGDPIHFNHLTTLWLYCSQDSEIPENVIFHKLTILVLVFDFDPSDKLIQFMGEQVNSNLRQLTVECKKCSLSKDRFLEIPKKLPNLAYAHIVTKTRFVADDIIDFLMRSKQLAKVELTVDMVAVEAQRLKDSMVGICTSTDASIFGDSAVFVFSG